MKSLVLNDEEVQGLLSGQKTHHCFPIQPQPTLAGEGDLYHWDKAKVGLFFLLPYWEAKGTSPLLPHAPYKLGDQFWVKEAWTEVPRVCYRADGRDSTECRCAYLASGWGTASTMPKWASRLTLTVRAVTVARVQALGDIAPHTIMGKDIEASWNKQHRKSPWATNPWVWVVQIDKQKGEIYR
jgi:hypothetical protein